MGLFGWGECEGEFVVQTAAGVGEHLVFVDDESARSIAGEDPFALGLEGGDEDGRAGVFRDVAGGDPDVPAAAAPFGPFVVGEGAGGNRVDSLATASGGSRVDVEFEDAGFARPGGGVNENVVTGGERADGPLLPEIGNVEGDLETGHGI